MIAIDDSDCRLHANEYKYHIRINNTNKQF